MVDIWVRDLNNIFVRKVCVEAQFGAYIVNTMPIYLMMYYMVMERYASIVYQLNEAQL